MLYLPHLPLATWIKYSKAELHRFHVYFRLQREQRADRGKHPGPLPCGRHSQDEHVHDVDGQPELQPHRVRNPHSHQEGAELRSQCRRLRRFQQITRSRRNQ